MGVTGLGSPGAIWLGRRCILAFGFYYIGRWLSAGRLTLGLLFCAARLDLYFVANKVDPETNLFFGYDVSHLIENVAFHHPLRELPE